MNTPLKYMYIKFQLVLNLYVKLKVILFLLTIHLSMVVLAKRKKLSNSGIAALYLLLSLSNNCAEFKIIPAGCVIDVYFYSVSVLSPLMSLGSLN